MDLFRQETRDHAGAGLNHLSRYPAFLQARPVYLDRPDPITGDYYTSYRVFPDPERERRRRERELARDLARGDARIRRVMRPEELREAVCGDPAACASPEMAECEIVGQIEARQLGRRVINSERRAREERALLGAAAAGAVDPGYVLEDVEEILRACKEKERYLVRMLAEKRREEGARRGVSTGHGGHGGRDGYDEYGGHNSLGGKNGRGGPNRGSELWF